MPPSALTELLSTFAVRKGILRVSITRKWMQGRTTYGGCSAALCLEGARRLLDDPLQPLRSAQITFLGPAGGDCEVLPSVLRQGRAMSFVRSDLLSSGQLATSCTFAFGRARPSAFDELLVPPPPSDLALPEACPQLFSSDGTRPQFTVNFDCRLARGGRPASSSIVADNWIWVRHVGATDDGTVDGVAPEVALLALADAPPPSIVSRFDAWAPIASATWQVNLLHEEPVAAAAGGWWLLRTSTEHARDGYSSQNMLLYGSDGRAVLASRQLVVIYDRVTT